MRNDTSSKHVAFIGLFGDQGARPSSESDRDPDTTGRVDYTVRACPEPLQALYRELDGAIVRRADANWPLSVYAIHETGADRWIQLAADGSGEHDLIVHATSATSTDDIIASVEAWLADPGSSGRVLHVS